MSIPERVAIVPLETHGHYAGRRVCAQSHVGRIIGKGGVTVRGIQLFANVTVGIDQSHNPALILIVGALGNVELAFSIMDDILAGHFKGFALLREMAFAQRVTGDISALKVVYRPGRGIFPRRCLSTLECAPENEAHARLGFAPVGTSDALQCFFENLG